MKLLVLTPDFPDKEEKYRVDIFVKEQIRFLAKYFDEVTVISPIAYGMEYFRKAKYQDYTYDNVRVYFPHYFNNPLFYFIKKNLWTKLEVRAVSKIISDNGLAPDIIHAHFTWPSGALAIRLKERMGIPVVITEHTSNSFNQAISSRDRAYIDAWKNADKIIRVRNSDVHLFEQVDIDLSKVISIPNGFDAAIFHHKDAGTCRNALGLPCEKKIVLNIGNLYGDVKGHRYLIEAIRIAVKQRDDIFCCIVGSGKLYGDLKKQLFDLGLGEHVKLIGGKPHHELSLWINACDVFVLPSLNEGNPTVMFEALGCGKPFVGTKVGGVPEVITSDDYGLLVEPADPEDLAEKILVALDREWDSEAILAYAERYTWEDIAKEITNIYLGVLEHKRDSPSINKG
jgi:glycosyltransferase involved in cell wall biosynthesis